MTGKRGSWLIRARRYAGRVADDIHRGMIAGLERLWYG